MPQKHNITFIGPEASGKTQILNRLNAKNFNSTHKLTMGLKPTKKDYTDKDLEITYEDVGPNVETGQINAALMKSSKICLVFDASESDWQEKLDRYLDEKKIVIPPESQLLFLGNKMDLIQEDRREAVTTAITLYADEKFTHCTTEAKLISANAGTSIPELTKRVLANLPAPFFLPASRRGSVNQGAGSTFSRTSAQQLVAKFKSGKDLQLQDLLVEEDDDGDEEFDQRSEHENGHGEKGKGRGPSRVLRTPDRVGNRPRYTPTRPNSSTPPTDTTLSFALRMAGLALIITAITSLIYLAIVAAGLLSSVAVTAVVNQVAVTIGGLLGMTAPATALTQLFATYGLSTAVGSELLAASASVVTLGLGYGLRRLGQKPVAANDELDPPATRSTLSFALRLLGIALLLAAVVNLVYLLLIAINVLPAAGLMAGMSSLLGTVGGVLGFSAPMAAFTNACAAIGVSATAATGVLSATGSVLMAGMGYSLFKRNPLVRPPVDELSSAHQDTNGRATPPLEVRQPRRK